MADDQTHAVTEEQQIMEDVTIDTATADPPLVASDAPDTNASTLSSLGSTPTRDEAPITARTKAGFNDIVSPDAAFWIEINPPQPTFNRDAYEIDEEEFNVGGIYAEDGEGDDLRYDVQFEDDHTATVSLHTP